MIDILLIAPQNKKQIFQSLTNGLVAFEPPTFMLLVASYLRKKGLSVQCIDGQFFSPEEIAKETEYLDPVLVGLYVYGNQPSASTQCMPSARETALAIKNLNPNRKIMISGTHPAAIPAQTLDNEPIDYVCDREGFETPYFLVQYLKNFYQNSVGEVVTRQPEKIFDIPDLWYRGFLTDRWQPQFTHRGTLLTNEQLDEIETPAWDLVEQNGKLDHYRCHNWHAFNTGDRSPYASMYTTFGCPYKCSFCCINSPFGDMYSGARPYRSFSPSVIIKQIETLVHKYNIRNIKFVDEMFVLNPKHVLGVCDEINKRDLGKDINIWAYARVDTAKDKFLQSLKKAGFNWLCLGIESGSEHVRDGADKIYSNDDIRNVVQRIQNQGIYIIGNYIFGLPDDDMTNMQKTYDLAVELNCEFGNFYSAMAYPGSPLWHDAVNNGSVVSTDWSTYSQHSYDCFPLNNNHCTNAEILAFRDEKHLEYHARPEYQQMILTKFGQRALDEINQMLSFGKPRRKILGD